MAPLLSFIIPAFNAEQTIEVATRSVLEQSHQEIELVIVDDGSTDETFARAAKIIDPRVRVARRTNRGVAASRNLGLVLARGEYVCFLDADDALLPSFAASVMDSIGDSDGISTAYLDTDAELRPAARGWYPARSELRLDRLRTNNPLAIGATVFRAGVLHEVTRHFGEAFPLNNQVEDWELLLRFTSLGAKWAEPIQVPLMLCRLMPGSRSAQSQRVWEDGQTLLSRWVPMAERSNAQRNWSIVHFARALANEQGELASRLYEEIGTLTENDAPTFVGALRVWAIRQQTSTSRRVLFDELHKRIAPIAPSLASRIAADALAPSWHELALRAARSLTARERLVVYGFGRNGREASRALAAASIAHKVIDDDPGFSSPLRTTIAELGANDVVLLTPDRRDEILARLAPARFSRILTPDTLQLAPGEAA
ncbi:MAG: glycosyltransferase [Phycisphaerales bacterium]